MRTPAEYTNNLKNGIVTTDMMEYALYSVNKRAKNWRDREREYRDNRYDKYHNEEKARAEKEKMYQKKEQLLKYLSPVCIHCVSIATTYKVYDDEVYDAPTEYIRTGKYYDREEQREVIFWVCKGEGKEYRLFYECGEHTFHSKYLTEDEAMEISKRDSLDIIYIGELITRGYDYTELLSMQFVDKLIDALQSGKAVFQK